MTSSSPAAGMKMMMVEGDQGNCRAASIVAPGLRASRDRLLCCAFSSILCVIAAVSVGVAVMFACEVRVDHSSPVLVSPKHGVVGTAKALYPLDPRTLPGRDDVMLYSNLKQINLHVNGVLRGFQVTGYAWYNATDMDLFLASNHLLHITSSNMTLHALDRQGDVYGITPGRRLGLISDTEYMASLVGIALGCERCIAYAEHSKSTTAWNPYAHP